VDDEFEHLLSVTKKAAAALRDAEVPFVLGGGLACWARGGARTEHDVDFLIRARDADRALEALEAAGMRTERPPEEWLVKAYDDGVRIDLIHHPSGLQVDGDVFERAEELSVHALRMNVASLEDVLVTKLLAINEQRLEYASVLEIARSLREQIDFDTVRARTADSPYARAFFTLADGLGITSGRACKLRRAPRSEQETVETRALEGGPSADGGPRTGVRRGERFSASAGAASATRTCG
jgi:predicted nucleotidyltransferase